MSDADLDGGDPTMDATDGAEMDDGSSAAPEDTSSATATDAVDATNGLSLDGPLHRMGQLWSGAADYVTGTASSGVHLVEYAYDSATGDSEGADRHYNEVLQDKDKILHGLSEVGEGMGL